LRALDEELVVILESAPAEALIPGPSLFGVKSDIAHKDDGDCPVAATSVDLTRVKSVQHKEGQSSESAQGPFGTVWIGMTPSLLQYESSLGPIRIPLQ